MSGLVKLGFAYGTQALSRGLDGTDHTIAINDMQIGAHYIRQHDGLTISLTKDGDTIEMSSRQARDMHDVLHGIIAADLQIDPEPLTDLIASRAEMLALIRDVGAAIDSLPEAHMAEWNPRIAAILAKFPVKP